MTLEQEIVSCLPLLRKYAMYLTCNWHDMEDLIQNVLNNYLEDKSHEKPSKSLQGWLLTMMKNLFIDQQRKRKIEIIYCRNIFKIENNSIKINYKKIKNIIRTSTRKWHDTVCLRYLFDLEYKEISNFLNKNISNVSSEIKEFRIYMNKNYTMEDFIS